MISIACLYIIFLARCTFLFQPLVTMVTGLFRFTQPCRIRDAHARSKRIETLPNSVHGPKILVFMQRKKKFLAASQAGAASTPSYSPPNKADSYVTSFASSIEKMRNSLRVALNSSSRKRSVRRRGGSYRASAAGRQNRVSSPRSRSRRRRAADQFPDSLSSEQFILDPDDAVEGQQDSDRSICGTQSTASRPARARTTTPSRLSTNSHLRAVADEEGLNTTDFSGFVFAVTPPALEPAPIKMACSPDGYGEPRVIAVTPTEPAPIYSLDGYDEPGATTVLQRNYADSLCPPRRLSLDGDDPLNDGSWGQYLELDETETAQRAPALIIVPYMSPAIDVPRPRSSSF